MSDDDLLLLPFFEWAYDSWLGTVMAESIWLWATVEAVHLLGLALLGGALLVVDLRMLGLGLTRQSIAALASEARPWLIGAVATLLVTGMLLFPSQAFKVYWNTSFWVKMATLPLALTFTFTVRARVAEGGTEATTRTRVVAVTSLALWFIVAAAGRWIGYSG